MLHPPPNSCFFVSIVDKSFHFLLVLHKGSYSVYIYILWVKIYYLLLTKLCIKHGTMAKYGNSQSVPVIESQIFEVGLWFEHFGVGFLQLARLVGKILTGQNF